MLFSVIKFGFERLSHSKGFHECRWLIKEKFSPDVLLQVGYEKTDEKLLGDAINSVHEFFKSRLKFSNSGGLGEFRQFTLWIIIKSSGKTILQISQKFSPSGE